MRRTGRKNLGYPRSQQSEQGDIDTRIPGCRVLNFFEGGVGGPWCPIILGVTQFVYPIRVSKFLVKNRSLVLHNDWPGVDIYTDGGPEGYCSISHGVQQPWWLGFSADGSLTDGEVIAQGNKIERDTLLSDDPYQIEILGNKLPQPTLLGGGANPDWEYKIYIHIVWLSADYIQDTDMIENILEIAKHDYDIKI